MATVTIKDIARMADVSINTVGKLLAEAGEASMAFHDEKVRDVHSKRVQCDEIWSFCAAKNVNVDKMKRPVDGAGDVWTWTALDADTKLILSFRLGDRTLATAYDFMHDVAERISNRTPANRLPTSFWPMRIM